MNWKKWAGLILLPACILGWSGCEKNKDEDEDPDAVPKETQARNIFAVNLMKDIYLWNDHAISMINGLNLDIKKEEDPIKLYGKMVHPDDNWSFMTDDMEKLTEQVNNESKSYGYYLQIWGFKDSKSYFAVVLYAYPGTPAAKAGLTRGDIIRKVNGQDITEENYVDLVLSSQVEIELGEEINGVITPSGKKVSMTSVKTYQDPVIYHSIIQKGVQKIGYLMYTDFVKASHERLLEVFKEFRTANVNEVILDFRYNGGGYTITAQIISNILAPYTVINGDKNIMTKDRWNTQMGETVIYFSKEVKYDKQTISITPVNLNLKRVYILTDDHTASSSELVIAALRPYMDVVLIGEKTVGKCYGGYLIDRDLYEELYKTTAPDLENWGAYIMAFQSTNKNNENYVNGFSPDYEVQDLTIAAPYGSESDPLINKALEDITGTPVSKSIPRGTILDNKVHKSSLQLPKTTGFDGMININGFERIKEIQ